MNLLSCFCKKDDTEKQTISFERFDSVKNDMKPLDLLLFAGDEFVSKMIAQVESLVVDERVTKYEIWTHVGVLINTQVCHIKNGIQGEWYVYEITMSGKLAGDETPDVETGNFRFGTQVRRLRDVLHTYKGEIAYCSLNNNPVLKKEDEDDSSYLNRIHVLRERITDFKKKYYNVHYQYEILRLFATAFTSLRFFRKFLPISRNWIMCSALITELYKEIGVLDDSVERENVLPQDFLGFDKDNEIPNGMFLPPVKISCNQ